MTEDNLEGNETPVVVQGTPLAKESPHQTFEAAAKARTEQRPAGAYNAAVDSQLKFTKGVVVPQDNSPGAGATPFSTTQEGNENLAKKQQ